MAFVAVDKDGTEAIYELLPIRIEEGLDIWITECYPNGDSSSFIRLPSGSIEKLIGRPLTWADDAVEI